MPLLYQSNITWYNSPPGLSPQVRQLCIKILFYKVSFWHRRKKYDNKTRKTIEKPCILTTKWKRIRDKLLTYHLNNKHEKTGRKKKASSSSQMTNKCPKINYNPTLDDLKSFRQSISTSQPTGSTCSQSRQYSNIILKPPQTHTHTHNP